MDKLLTGLSVYDPSEISVTLAGFKPYGFAHDTKIVLKSVDNVLAEFHLQASSQSCQDLMKCIGETVDYKVNYQHENRSSWEKSMSDFLDKSGEGRGRLEYELVLGSEFPVVKFYIVGE